ncbi:MAG: dTDP-4-dehydrorhamnose reductase [Planctomycetota bacterium]
MEGARRVVLVTGAAGMLGSQVMRTAPPDREAVPTTRGDTDLAEADAVERLCARVEPAGVIHAAGYTHVDRAETAEETAHRDNAVATRVVADACRRRGIPLVIVSTDYVFDGRGARPYRETDEPGPVNAYGRTKLAAERAAPEARIVRSAWLYGPRGRHFPGQILELAARQDETRVVNDQRGCPTSSLELAPVLWDVLERGTDGSIYHAACEGACTWYGLAVAVLELAGLSHTRVVPCATEEFPRPAPRPAYSVLDCTRLKELRGKPLAPWRDALRRYFEEERR